MNPGSEARVAELAEEYTLAATCFVSCSLLQHAAKVVLDGDASERERLLSRLEKFPDPTAAGKLSGLLVPGSAAGPDVILDGFLDLVSSRYGLTEKQIRPHKDNCGKVRLFLGLCCPFTMHDVTVGSFHELSYETARTFLLDSHGPEGSPARTEAAGDADPRYDVAACPVGDRWRETAEAIATRPAVDLEKLVYGLNEEYQTSKSIESRR